MSVIAPAILTNDPEDYRSKIERMHEFINRAHIDIADGEFAPTFTLTPEQIWWPQEWDADIHAMVARPSDYLEPLIRLRPNTIIFHAETGENVVAALKEIKKYDIRAGLALLRPTVPATVADAIKEADHVMIFSGELGRYGGEASLMQIEKIRLIREINPSVEIGWDGGVTVDNAFSIAQAGVDVLNVGATLANSEDPKATYDKLVSEINKHGII